MYKLATITFCIAWFASCALRASGCNTVDEMNDEQKSQYFERVDPKGFSRKSSARTKRIRLSNDDELTDAERAAKARLKDHERDISTARSQCK